MERRNDDGEAKAEKTAVELSRGYGDWTSRELGPDWVEVEPGIFMPAADRPPEPESLDEALRAELPEPDQGAAAATPDEPLRRHARAKRGWFRRV
jgi:hypothetical protein